MKKNTSRLLSSLLVLCMVLALLPGMALAADSDFTIENGVLTQYNGAGGAVTIPAGVTSIGDRAFQECQSLTSVTIPAGVTSIGECAFQECQSLTSVTIPDSVTSIGDWAFCSCKSLTSVTIPDNLTNIGGAAFFDTPWLDAMGDFAILNGIMLLYRGDSENVVFPAGVTSIGGFVLGVYVSEPYEDSVASVPYGSFPYVTSVTIPNGVTSIQKYAFTGCPYLASVTIPDSVTNIEGSAFIECYVLKDIYYGGSEEQWKAIEIDYYDNDLFNATIHYNSTGPSIPATGTAYPSTQTVDIDGTKVNFQMYALRDDNGGETNYIKVRDLALAMSTTKAPFDVLWDGVINLVPGSVYKATGTENSTPFSGKRTYKAATDATNVDGKASDLSAFILTDDNGGDYTYYQLRDLARCLGFNVSWSQERGVFIESDKPYSELD